MILFRCKLDGFAAYAACAAAGSARAVKQRQNGLRRATVRWLSPVVGIGWGLLLVAAGHGATLDFDRDVRPVLERHCLDCHGADLAESNLRLDSPLHALRGGDSGEPAVVPGRSDQSYLIARVLNDDANQRMPPDAEPLAAADVETLRQWIDDAGGWKEPAAALATRELDHWAFQPVHRPRLPIDAAHSIDVAHPIDAFVEARLVDAKLTLSPRATRSKRIRRLYLVMLGLPPTPAAVDAFVHDDRDDAWQRLVDRVLASPRYGERWATHWLDLVRFGETHGFETNRERPHAWHYRDWVVDAFNSDKPYDRFVVEQLAGDAVGAGIGTGFLVAGPYDLVKGQDPLLRLMQRQDELADIVNATGTAFLGLTLGCARCHNHKFDPISQTDYYALQAVFAGVDHSDRALPLPADAQARIAELDAEIAALKRQLARFAKQPADPQAGLRPAVDARQNLERFAPAEARWVRFTIEATNAGQPCLDELEVYSGDVNVALASAGAKALSSGDFVHPLHKLEHINDGRYGNARSWIASQVSGGWVQIEFADAAEIDRIVWARDREGRYGDRLATEYRIEASLDGESWSLLTGSADRMPFEKPPPQEPVYDFAAFPPAEASLGQTLLERLDSLKAQRDELAEPVPIYAGTFHQPGPTHRLYRGDPTAPREAVAPAAIQSLTALRLSADTPEQERRLAAARWIADRENPLTARVIVNRLWQFHFGAGIVDTPSDFGGNGTRPSHPELLDLLAVELMDHDWSLKHVQRLILTSQTWQQDSRPHAAGLAVDAASRLLWRFPPRRLEAEAIRDGMLAVSGVLDLHMGGPGFSAFEIEAENVRHYHPKQNFGPADWRRMVYMTKVRQERDAVFGVFDCPDCSQVVPKRSRSTTPLQALNLFNSRFVMQQAERFAGRLDRDADSPHGKIDRAYQLCFGRRPDPEEIEAAAAFIEETDWRAFARAMLNSNEFVFIP